MSDVVHIYTEDGWNALYIDGDLAYQGDSLNAERVLRILAASTITVTDYGSYAVDEDWLALESEFPDELRDVVLCN